MGSLWDKVFLVTHTKDRQLGESNVKQAQVLNNMYVGNNEELFIYMLLSYLFTRCVIIDSILSIQAEVRSIYN